MRTANNTPARCIFRKPAFVLVAALIISLGNVSPGFPQERSYLIDLNKKQVTQLGTLGGSTFAAGINDSGQVVGYSATSTGETHAFITGPNGTGMTDLGTLGGDYSIASGINAAGQVVGVSGTSNGDHAFITGPDGVGMRDIGTFGDFSIAYGINAAGQVVGDSDTSDGTYHAFVTGPNGMGMTDLNTSVSLNGVVLSSATAINDQGQVVAIGSVPIIPEPEIYLMLLAGLGFLGLVSRRQLTQHRPGWTSGTGEYG